jgi:hypothetical protein
MEISHILNPETGRMNQVKAWTVDTRRVFDELKSGKSAHDLGWMLLSDPESLREMEESQYGDCLENNFALNVFESALDWSLGLAILRTLQSYKDQFSKYPKSFRLAANTKGQVFLLGKSGKAYLICA